MLSVYQLIKVYSRTQMSNGKLFLFIVSSHFVNLLSTINWNNVSYVCGFKNT